MYSESKRYAGFQRSFSVPSSSPSQSGRFREPAKTWSPKSDDSDQSINSDEENHVAMETDCCSDNERKAQAPLNKTFTLKASTFPRTMTPDASPSPKASSKLLSIGRPMKAIGLKDVDLSKNARAVEIRTAMQTNKCSPTRQNSCPAVNLNEARQRDLLENTSKSPQRSPGNRYFPVLQSSIEYNTDDDNKYCKPEIKPDLSIVPYTLRNNGKSKFTGKLSKLYSTKNYEETDANDVFEKNKVAKNDIETIEIIDDDCHSGHNIPLLSPLGNDSNVTKRRPRKHDGKSPTLGSFSDEDDEKVECSVKDSTKGASPIDKMPNKRNKHSSKLNCGFLIRFISVITLITAIVIYLVFNSHELCMDSEFTYNISGLESDLKQEFFGQHLALRVILSSLKGHNKFRNKNKPLVLSLHGWTGTGKNFVSGLIAKHIFKHGIKSKFIHKFIIPLHFTHTSEANLYRKQLKDWISGNITQCSKGGLFIFDEMDKITPNVVTVLKPFLDPKGAKTDLNFNKVIFLFLTNAGGKLINNFVLQHYKKGLTRESIELVQLERLLHAYVDRNPNAWYQELLKDEVIDHFVPFLPLEKSHVEQCIRRDLRSKGYIELDTMVDEITNEMNYFPEDLELFSVSGCKKVSSKVDVAMG